MKLTDLKAGDRVAALYDDGWHGGIIYADVVRVNCVTVTVRNEQGHIQRVDPAAFSEKLSEAEKERTYEFFPPSSTDAAR